MQLKKVVLPLEILRILPEKREISKKNLMSMIGKPLIASELIVRVSLKKKLYQTGLLFFVIFAKYNKLFN